MSKILRTILDAKEPIFSTTLRQLERMTGSRSIDVAYIADMTARAHTVMRRIGLNPADTTNKELYQALKARADHEQLFNRTDDVALVRGSEVISFNHEDIVENASLPFSERTIKHARTQIYLGLTARYIAADGDNGAEIEAMMSHVGAKLYDLEQYHDHKAAAAHDHRPHILFVGDIFTDVFIKLNEKEARIEKDKDGSKRLSIPFGNKPPYDEAEVVHSVGPSPNAAVSCARLGVRSSLMSWLGDDQVGRESLQYLTKERVDTAPVVVQKKTPSSTYYVLRYGADRTILVKNEDYRYEWRKPAVAPTWIYLSLLSPDSWKLHEDLIEYLEDNPKIKLAFQPGTFHFKWGAKKLKKIYARSEIVVMNREEAVEVTGKDHGVVRQLAEALHELGPKYVVITDGPHGSYAYHEGKLMMIDNYPDPAPPYDRTGAGDAFASTIVAGLALGEDFETALTWAPINSMSVVQKLGAQAGLLKRSEVDDLLKKAPRDYKVKEYTR